MGLSIAQYGQSQFSSEIANLGGGNRAVANRREGRGQRTESPERTEQQKVPQYPGRRPDRKPAEIPSTSTEEAPPTQVRAPERLKASSRSSTSTSELQFQVKTAEGDTVTLSVNAVEQSSVDKVSYKSEDGSLKVAQKTQSSSIQANLSVEGDLSEEELADISKALESLSQGKSIEDLGTLESASFQYNNRTIYTQSQLSYLG